MTIFWNNQILFEFFFFVFLYYSFKISCVGGSNRTNVKTWGFNPVLNHLSYSHNICYRSISWSEWCRTTVVGTRIRSNTVILRPNVFFFVVEAGLKPAIFALRGRWLNQFVYSTVLSLLSDSNQRPMGYDAIALPSWAKEANCRPTRTRTQKKRFGISHVTITSWVYNYRAV